MNDSIDPRLSAGVRVLVVEDDLELCEMVCAMLSDAGLEVISAADGEKAVELLDGTPPPGLVLTDLMLPGIQGDKLVERIKARNPATPVIVMSAINSVDQAVALLRLGADDYLTKPLDLAHLLGRVTHALESIAMAREVANLESAYQSLKPERGVVWGSSPAMIATITQIPSLARTDAPVLVWGESGVGKEIVARSIHYASRRASGPMVSVSCAAIPEGLWEREFFGHVAGAFSDAGAGAPGVVESADGGTLFLDEIGEVPLAMQAKLLRFLQEKEYRRVGDTALRRSDVRIVSATNRDLKAESAAGRFREDLYYRIGVLPLVVPPLRDRKEDVPLLATHFLRKYAAAYDTAVVGFSPRALHRLASYDYPGNVRELENVVQQALAKTRYSVVGADDLSVGDESITEPRYPGPEPAKAKDEAPAAQVDLSKSFADAKAEIVANFEASYCRELLFEHKGNITHAAAAAKMTRKSLSQIVKRHRLGEESPSLAPRAGRPRRDR